MNQTSKGKAMHYRLEVIFIRTRKTEKAEADYLKAIELSPEFRKYIILWQTTILKSMILTPP